MTTLHDRLADLAEGAPPGGPEPELWWRAVRDTTAGAGRGRS